MGPQQRGDQTQRSRVEAGEGVVDDDDVWVGGQGRGDVDAGDLGPGEVLQRCVAAVGELEVAEQGQRIPFGRAQGDPVQAGEVDDLVEHAHVRVSAAFRGQIAEVLPVAEVEFEVLEFDRALISGDEAHDDAHQFGAARRAGSHDCGDPARLGGETHLVQICPLPFAQGNLFQCEHASSFTSNSSWGVSHLSC